MNLARALADAIQGAHKDYRKQTCRRFGDHFICSMPALSERSVLIFLAFYYKRMLERVRMQKTQQFSAFVCHRKNPVKRNANANLPISHDPVVRISRNFCKKNSSETTLMIYDEKSEF